MCGDKQQHLIKLNRHRGREEKFSSSENIFTSQTSRCKNNNSVNTMQGDREVTGGSVLNSTSTLLLADELVSGSSSVSPEQQLVPTAVLDSVFTGLNRLFLLCLCVSNVTVESTLVPSRRLKRSCPFSIWSYSLLRGLWGEQAPKPRTWTCISEILLVMILSICGYSTTSLIATAPSASGHICMRTLRSPPIRSERSAAFRLSRLLT